MNDARMTLRLPGEYKESMAVKEELPECVRGMVGIIPAGERDSVDEYHDYLMERYA